MTFTFFKKAIQFLKDVANDQRIPTQDKRILMAMIGLIISPIDIIPDWIPLIGILDDLLILAIILDYFFRVLDSRVLLNHYPWGMKSFARLKRLAGMITWMVPDFIKKRIWTYVGSPFEK